MSTAWHKEVSNLRLNPWVERRHSKHQVMSLPSAAFFFTCKVNVFDPGVQELKTEAEPQRDTV